MADPDEHMRWAAAHGLGAIAAGAHAPALRRAALADLVDGLRDDSALVRRECTRVLRGIDLPEATQGLETAAAAAAAQRAILASSSFDDGPGGWTVYGDAYNFAHRATGGDPGGYISAHDESMGADWGFQAPAAFLGDRSAAYGGSLDFELKQSVGDDQYDADDVVLFGGGTRIVLDTPYNPASDWTPYSIPLDDSADWRRITRTGPAASAEDIRQVLSDLEAIRIRGEFTRSLDSGALDNVVLCAGPRHPEPE